MLQQKQDGQQALQHRRLMDGQSVSIASCAVLRRAAQRSAGSGPDVDYMHGSNAMQVAHPSYNTIITTTTTTIAVPPPPHQSKCRQTHLRSSCQKGVRRVGSNYHVAGRPLSPGARPGRGPSTANASATHKKWHHFLVKRDERLPLLHIGPCYHARQSRYYRQYSDLSCSLSRLPDWALGPMARCSAIVPILSIRHEPPGLPLGRWSPPRGWLLVGGQSDSMRSDTVPWVICLCPVLLSNVSKHRLGTSLSCRRHPPPRAGAHALRCHPPPPGPISSISLICPPQPPREITHTRDTTGDTAWGRERHREATLGPWSRRHTVSGRAQTAMLP